MAKKFVRKDINKKKRISGGGWRKPKGITNKMRLNRKGHPSNVRPGYGSPDAERNKVAGLEIVSVYNVSDVEKIKPKNQCVVIGRVGKQKKLDIIKKAEELKLTIVNLKVDKFKESAQDFFDARQKLSKEKLDEKKKKEEELKKEAEKKEAEKKKSEAKEEKEQLSDEEKQKQEKKEKDKILTQKNSSGL